MKGEEEAGGVVYDLFFDYSYSAAFGSSVCLVSGFVVPALGRAQWSVGRSLVSPAPGGS